MPQHTQQSHNSSCIQTTQKRRNKRKHQQDGQAGQHRVQLQSAAKSGDTQHHLQTLQRQRTTAAAATHADNTITAHM